MADTVVDAKGHTLEVIPAVPATCTTEGLSAGVTCSFCNEVLIAQDTVEALGHKLAHVEAVGSHCHQGWQCGVLGLRELRKAVLR